MSFPKMFVVIVFQCVVAGSAPLILSWTTNIIVGYTKRTVTVTILVIAGAVGGFAGGLVYQEKDMYAGNFVKGHVTCTIIITVGLLLTLLLRTLLILTNRKRDQIMAQNVAFYNNEDNDNETDYNLRFRYTY